MRYTILTTNNARRDISDAIAWENNRAQGLSERFLRDLDQKLSAIARAPYIGQVRYENVRCVATKVFSYLIHYVIDDTHQKVIILRVLSTSRRPIW